LGIGRRIFNNGEAEGEGLLVGMSLRFALRLSEVLLGTTLLTVGVLGALPEDTDGAGGTSRSLLGVFTSLIFSL
jgi:hypothetical protein